MCAWGVICRVKENGWIYHRDVYFFQFDYRKEVPREFVGRFIAGSVPGGFLFRIWFLLCG